MAVYSYQMGKHGEDGAKTLLQCGEKRVKEIKREKDFAGIKQKVKKDRTTHRKGKERG